MIFMIVHYNLYSASVGQWNASVQQITSSIELEKPLDP